MLSITKKEINTFTKTFAEVSIKEPNFANILLVYIKWLEVMQGVIREDGLPVSGFRPWRYVTVL